MAKCGFFYDIFKVVVVVIDGSDYLHGDDIPPTVPFLPSSYGQCLLNPDSFTATSNLNAKYSVLNTSEILFTLPLKIPGMVHDKREDELPLM